jgi:hypothetical protein
MSVMPERDPSWHAAECLLPGVTPELAGALAGRIRAELAASATGVAFTGPQAQVRAVSERAGLPFERIVACVGLDWLA